MTALPMLRAVANGARVEPGLLGTCRMAHGGAEAHGEEAILTAFRRAPLDLTAAQQIECPHAALLVTPGAALFAELSEGWAERLWRIGARAATPEAAIGVAFDPDLKQARGDVIFDAADHPDLDGGAAPRVIDAGRRFAAITGPRPDTRARAFVIRAFGTGTAGAALFACYRLSADPVRRGSFSYAATLWSGDTATDIADAYRPTAAMARLVA